RHYEVLKHITEIGYVIGTQNMLIRLDQWNKLPKDQQDVLAQAARDAEVWEAKIDADYTHEAREKVIASGVKVYTPNAEEMKKWRDTLAPTERDQFTGEVPHQV